MAITMISKLPLHGFPSLIPNKMVHSRRALSCVCMSRASQKSINGDMRQGLYGRFLFPDMENHRLVPGPIAAVGSGLEASISDSEANKITLKNVKIVVESRDDDTIHVRVDLTGEQTQRAFDDVITDLARTAPPIPGFRRVKGGKTPNVPKSFLLQALGRSRVTKFSIEEIVRSTMSDFVKQENLKVKKKFMTTQTAKELQLAFRPGNEFGFNATMEIEKSETETTLSSSS